MRNSSRLSVLLSFLLSLTLVLSNSTENCEHSAVDKDKHASLDASDEMLKHAKDIAINTLEIEIPLLTFELSDDDCCSITHSNLEDLKQIMSTKGVAGVNKCARMLKIGAHSSFEEGMCFDVFHEVLKSMLSISVSMRIVWFRKISFQGECA